MVQQNKKKLTFWGTDSWLPTQLDAFYPVPAGTLSELGADPIDDWPPGAVRESLDEPEIIMLEPLPEDE